MKICMLSFHCCPFSLIGGDGVGGMNVFLKELSSVLTDNPDVTVDILTRIQNSSPEAFLEACWIWSWKSFHVRLWNRPFLVRLILIPVCYTRVVVGLGVGMTMLKCNQN